LGLLSFEVNATAEEYANKNVTFWLLIL